MYSYANSLEKLVEYLSFVFCFEA